MEAYLAKWTHVFFITFVIYSGISLSKAQDATRMTYEGGTEEPSLSVEEEKITAEQKSIQALYKMANIFLGDVIKPTNLSKLNQSVQLSDFNAILDSIQNDWQLWVKYYYPYVICMGIAAVYILVIPISGCIICGCRKSGKCGAKGRNMDGKRTKWYRRLCTAVLLLFSTGVLFGVVCMFVSNELLYEETKNAGLPSELSKSIDRLDAFIAVTRETYNSYVDNQLTHDIMRLRDRIQNTPSATQRAVGIVTGVSPYWEVLEAYILRLNETYHHLVNIDSTVADLNTKIPQLKTVINELKSNISRDFITCSGPASTYCEMVTDFAKSLTVNISYTGLPNLAGVAMVFRNALTGSDNIYANMSTARDNYNKIQDTVQKTSGSVIQSMSSRTDEVINKTKTFLNDIFGGLEDLSLNQAKMTINTTVSPQLELIGRYRYYICIAISVIFLLIAVLCFFGVLFGACGGQTGQLTECCNKKSGAKILKAALVFIFVLSWLIMIIIAILFPIGGIAHNDICRNLKLPSVDVSSTAVVDEIIVKGLNLPVSFISLYDNCAKDQAIFTALELEAQGQKFDLSKIINPDNYDIDSKLADLKSKNYTVGSVELANADFISQILNLSYATDQIDLSAHALELNKLITSRNLTEFTETMKIAATKSPSQKSLFQFYADLIFDIDSNQYAAVNRQILILRTLVSRIENFKTINATNVILSLRSLQDTINSTVITSAITNVTNELKNDFNGLLDKSSQSVRWNLARCGPLADIISDTIGSICLDVLGPYNAFWFSTGWCLIFFIFIIPIVMILNDLYKKERYAAGERLENTSISTTSGAFDNDRRKAIDRGKYNGRPLPDPMSTEIRGVPYSQLPAISGARASPVTDVYQHNYNENSRVHNNVDMLDIDQRAYDRQWNNLAYDDTGDGVGYSWRETDRSQNPYRSASREPYRGRSGDQYNRSDNIFYNGAREPEIDYPRDSLDRPKRQTMYPEDFSRW